MIKNIIFDIGNVLVEFNVLRTTRQMGLPEEEAQIIASAALKHWDELDRGILPKETVFKNIVKTVPPQYAAVAKCFLEEHILETVTKLDYSPEWLKSLKDQGYNIYLLTNYPTFMFEVHYRELFNFAQYVDGFVVSSKIKLIKPDPAIFNYLLQTYQLKAAESVFIDDRQDNVQAAGSVGIKGLRFINYQETKAALEKLLA